jgi:hypothetical protein
MTLKLSLTLSQPALPPLHPGDDLGRVELERHPPGLRPQRRLLWLAAQPRVLLLAPSLPGLAKELAPALRRAQSLRQLIAARLAVELVLGLVGRARLGHDLAGDPIELKVHLRAGVARDPRAVDRNHSRRHQVCPITEPEHLAEQLRQRSLVPADKPRDRRVIRDQVAGDHPVGHVLATVTLDRTRGPLPRRERVQHKRHHQRRLIRRPAMTARYAA